MKTRTASQLDLTVPTQSLKRTLSASYSEVSLDYKNIGSALAPLSADLPVKQKMFKQKSRLRPRNLTDMAELSPILGLASLITETEPQVSLLSASEIPCKHRCLKLEKPPLRTFSPGALSRAATHAAIAYFIWRQKSHSNCSIPL